MLIPEYRPIKGLHKLPNNPRIIKDNAFKTLCDSLRSNPDFFEARPLILSDRTGELVIIAGNQRFEAAKAIGLKEVPTALISGLTEEKEREIIIRDNVSNGNWDYDLLANEWSDMPLSEWGVVGAWDVEDDTQKIYDEKEIDDKLPTTSKCPSCGYEW